LTKRHQSSLGRSRRPNGRHTHDNLNPPDDSAGPAGSPAIRSDVDGLAAVMNALGHRQFDLWAISRTEWERMSPRRQSELMTAQNRREQIDRFLGATYLLSDALEKAVTHARRLFKTMTPERRRTVLHPRHLDEWLDHRRTVEIVAQDMTIDTAPDYVLRDDSYGIADEGPSPRWRPAVQLAVRINMDAPLDRVLGAIRDLVEGLHPPAVRRPRRASSAPTPTREKYDDDDIARMIEWYYRRGAGQSVKQLAIDAAGPTQRHVAAMQTRILRQLRWFERELGIT
jgi:hypothetical protein